MMRDRRSLRSVFAGKREGTIGVAVKRFPEGLSLLRIGGKRYIKV